MAKKTIICTHCGVTVDTTTAKRNCSNCFSCSGCERYICPQCDEGIIVKEVKRPNLRG